MHLVFFIRGINTQVELWKMFAQSQFLKWTRRDLETDEEFDVLYQMALRPTVMGAWELVFPEECLATVLSMMGLKTSCDMAGNVMFKKARLTALRTMLGVKQIPEKFFKEASELPESIFLGNSHRGLSHIMVHGAQVIPIGIKKDEYGEMYDQKADKTYWQEML